MGSDRARATYDPLQQYRSVVMQQGRVTLEADWNEASKITSEEIRKEALDIVGPCGTPDDGYAVLTLGFPGSIPFDFHIQSGTMYVGGMRVRLYDSVQYSNQPDWRDYGPEDPDWVDPAQFVSSPSLAPVREFVYLYLREQEVSAVEDPDLKDVALGGPDTAQRTRLLQRFVRVSSQGIDCASGLVAAEGKWEREGLYFDAPTMRLCSWSLLQVGFSNQSQTPNACQPQAQGGYLDPDNQLIRVQISGIDPQTNNPKFLWGFDNASFLYRINIDPNNPQNLVFQQVPVDANHQPIAQQAVEVLRTAADLPNGGDIAATSGFVFTLEENYNPDSQSVALPNGISLPADYTNANQSPPNQLFLRVWQQEVVFTPGQPAQLGNTGLLVTLETPNNQPFHIGDYWMFAVRPSTPQTVYPERYQNGPQRPDGPRLWACPLGVIVWREEKGTAAHGIEPTGIVVADCRPKFGPLATRALHITDINWPNDDVVSLAELQQKVKALQAKFDFAPDPNSISTSTMVVTLEIPVFELATRKLQTVAAAARASFRPRQLVSPDLALRLPLAQSFQKQFAAAQQKAEAAITVFVPREIPVGFSSLILLGQASAASNVATWTLEAPGYELIPYLSQLRLFGSTTLPPQLRVRVTFKGHDIWSQLENNLIHLDGQVFGEPGSTIFGGAPRTALSLPSGKNDSASDFESWFWLTLLAWDRTDYQIPSPSFVVSGDFNRDGNPDLAVATFQGGVFILLNNGDGTFTAGATYQTGAFPLSLVAADVTGNGILDLALTDLSGARVIILYGNGDGTFNVSQNPIKVGNGPLAMVAADFNEDGIADLAVVNASDNTISILLSPITNANPKVNTVKVGTTPKAIAAGHFSGRKTSANKPIFDLAVVNQGDNTVSVLEGDGQGDFTPVGAALTLPQGSTNLGLSILASDFNKDSFDDLAVGGVTQDASGNVFPYVAVFLNNNNNQGGGNFSPFEQLACVGTPSSLVAADFDGDGNIDLIAAASWWLDVLFGFASTNEFAVLMGNGDGTFQAPVIYPTGKGPICLCSNDFNRDGLPDLAVANLGDSTVSVYLNEQSQLKQF